MTEDIRSLGSCVKSFRAVICRPNQPFIASCIMATLGASTSDTMEWNPFWRSIYASLLSRLLMWNSNSYCIGLYFNLIHFCAKSWANKWSLHYLHGYSMYYCKFGCGISKMVGPKMQDFCPRINMLKGIFFKTILWWIMVRQKVPKSYFQSQFSMSKIDGIFSKKKSFKNINLGDHFL